MKKKTLNKFIIIIWLIIIKKLQVIINIIVVKLKSFGINHN